MNSDEIIESLLIKLKSHRFRNLVFESGAIIDNRQNATFHENAIYVHVTVSLIGETSIVNVPTTDPFYEAYNAEVTYSLPPWLSSTRRILNCITITKDCRRLHFRHYSFELVDPESLDRLFSILTIIDRYYDRQFENNL